ncbi:MAG TPA: hypothetical protein VFO12_01615 [Sphingomicrobium sp.]|nr:hypothetical protein [Sphingomicrobium sp.]
MGGGISRRNIWIASALSLAVAMRLFALWLAGDAIHYGDPLNYLRLATALSKGHGFALPDPSGGWTLTGYFPPALPMLLGAVALLVPLTPLTLVLVNTLIDITAALLLGRLAARLGRRDLGLPLSLAYLLWPSIAFMAPLAYKEGLIIALLLAMLVALLEQAERAGYRWALLSGLAGGALVLTQPSLAPLLPLLFLVFLKRFRGFRRWLSVSACAAAVALLLMLPWWLRNGIVFGEFIPLTTSGGLALWVGAHPSGGMVWKLPPSEWAQGGELEAGRLAAADAWRIIIADPAGYVTRCLVKFPLSFLQTNWALDQLLLAPEAPYKKLALSVPLRFGPTLIELGCALLAIFRLIRRPRSTPALLLWACIAQVMLFSIWFEFSERHRLFMTPFILMLAAMALAQQRSLASVRPQ